MSSKSVQSPSSDTGAQHWFDYIYDKKNPFYLQYSNDFSDELQKYLTNEPNIYGTIRILLVLPLVMCYALTIYVWPLDELFTLLSNWTLHL